MVQAPPKPKTWTKHTYTCGHWRLMHTEILSVNPTGGWPLGGTHNEPCADCR